MKKDYSLTAIILSIIFCVCAVGIDAMYFKRYVALYSAGIAIGAAMIIADIVCLTLRIKKQNQDERYYKILMLISMMCTIISLSIPVIGTLVIMFI